MLSFKFLLTFLLAFALYSENLVSALYIPSHPAVQRLSKPITIELANLQDHAIRVTHPRTSRMPGHKHVSQLRASVLEVQAAGELDSLAQILVQASSRGNPLVIEVSVHPAAPLIVAAFLITVLAAYLVFCSEIEIESKGKDEAQTEPESKAVILVELTT